MQRLGRYPLGNSKMLKVFFGQALSIKLTSFALLNVCCITSKEDMQYMIKRLLKVSLYPKYVLKITPGSFYAFSL